MFLISVTVPGDKPIIVISGTFLDFFLLVFLSIPLPILISVPIKAFVYMDINRRRQQNTQDKESSCCHFVCCCRRSEHPDSVDDASAEVSEHSDVDEEAPAENSSSVQTSLIITRFNRLNQQHNIMTTVIRERFANDDRENAHNSDDTNRQTDTAEVQQTNTDNAPVILPRFPSLYDLGSISEDVAETEETEATLANADNSLDSLPPSYSQAEGLDQLPSYSDVEVSRMRIGPYVMVYDKEHKNVLTFKKYNSILLKTTFGLHVFISVISSIA